MGYKCTFMDNDVYYAKDINEMFSNLTSEGVVLSGSGNLLTDLNTGVSEITSRGVQIGDSCKLSYKDEIYRINEGACFMADGSCIKFDSEGYIVHPINGVTTYVYIKRNETMNTIDVITSATAGGSGTVPIAEITADGKIYDTRLYSRAKVRLNQPGSIQNFEVTITGGDNAEKVVDVGRSDFERIIMNKVKFLSAGSIVEHYPSSNNTVEMTEGIEKIFYMKKNANSATSVIVYVTKYANTLELYLSGDTPGTDYTFNFDII